MSAVIRGKGGLGNYVIGPSKSTYKFNKGGQTTLTITGAQADITALALDYQLAGWETTIEEGPVWKLTVVNTVDINTNPGGGEPDPLPSWEVVGHSVQINILEAKRPITEFSPDDKAFIEYVLHNPLSAQPFASYLSSPTTIANAVIVQHLYKAGIEFKQDFIPVVKRTITVSRSYIPVNWTKYVGKVLSKAKLISEYNVPLAVAAILPAVGDADNQCSVTLNVDNVRLLDTFRGFLEQYPTYQTVANNKVQISQEWVFGKWSAGDDGLYDYVQ